MFWRNGIFHYWRSGDRPVGLSTVRDRDPMETFTAPSFARSDIFSRTVVVWSLFRRFGNLLMQMIFIMSAAGYRVPGLCNA